MALVGSRVLFVLIDLFKIDNGYVTLGGLDKHDTEVMPTRSFKPCIPLTAHCCRVYVISVGYSTSLSYQPFKRRGLSSDFMYTNME
jgi:hypothetical protein